MFDFLKYRNGTGGKVCFTLQAQRSPKAPESVYFYPTTLGPAYYSLDNPEPADYYFDNLRPANCYIDNLRLADYYLNNPRSVDYYPTTCELADSYLNNSRAGLHFPSTNWGDCEIFALQPNFPIELVRSYKNRTYKSIFGRHNSLWSGKLILRQFSQKLERKKYSEEKKRIPKTVKKVKNSSLWTNKRCKYRMHMSKIKKNVYGHIKVRKF